MGLDEQTGEEGTDPVVEPTHYQAEIGRLIIDGTYFKVRRKS
jgi:hypothetical protein